MIIILVVLINIFLFCFYSTVHSLGSGDLNAVIPAENWTLIFYDYKIHTRGEKLKNNMNRPTTSKRDRINKYKYKYDKCKEC